MRLFEDFFKFCELCLVKSSSSSSRFSIDFWFFDWKIFMLRVIFDRISWLWHSVFSNNFSNRIDRRRFVDFDLFIFDQKIANFPGHVTLAPVVLNFFVHFGSHRIFLFVWATRGARFDCPGFLISTHNFWDTAVRNSQLSWNLTKNFSTKWL